MQDLPDIYQMRKIGNSLYRAGLENIHPMYVHVFSSRPTERLTDGEGLRL